MECLISSVLHRAYFKIGIQIYVERWISEKNRKLENISVKTNELVPYLSALRDPYVIHYPPS